MKTIDTAALGSHLDQQVTGLVTCWIIEREDGQVYRFTDATEDLIVDGDTYSSVGAYKRSAIESTSTLSVDNLEVVGIAGDLSLPEQDLRNGLFDNARISIFMTAWSSLVPGKIRLRRGFFGEVQALPNGTFQVELRGLMQRLSYNYLDMFSPTCLYDLGEPACGIVIRPPQVLRNRNYSVGDVVLAAKSSAPSLGKRYIIDIADPSFESLASVGLNGSTAWFDAGSVPMQTTASTAISGTHSLRGGAGAGSTRQILDISTATEMPFDAVTSGNAKVRIAGYWRTTGDQARYQVRFYDDNFRTITLSRSAASTQRQRYTSTFNIAGDFTVSFWVKTNDNGTHGVMAGGSESGLSQGSDIQIVNRAVRLRANPFDINQNIVTHDPAVSVTAVNAGEWTHVAATRIGTTTTLYVNFEQVGQTNSAWGPFYFQDLFADNDEESALNILDGQLDDVRIYNVGKTQSEIILDAAAPPTIDATLLRWFSFDDSTINDQTGNDPNNYGAGTGVTYEISTAPINGSGAGTAGTDSGNVTVGSTWTQFQTGAIFVPANAKTMAITLTCTGNDVFFDAISGYMYDERETDSTFLPSDVDNLYWECTDGGTTAVTYPATFSGGAGSTAVDGGVVWTARNPYLRAGRVVTATDRRVFTSVISEARAVDGWFNGGSVIFVTGDNAGVIMEVKQWRQINGEIQLFLSLPHNIQTNDEFYIYPGCDKSRISCAAIFNNIINFFGFPDIPGQDELFRYPDAK